ncbi:hypothetical protein COLO4_07915 [Corchorus olitorius]|uniref:Uncharacterized protein n=1 Tax=Corchorus olitorius TaxID=93759 RepID=A0A1R3KI62_9ROSI|nr:hypothetical protein COLO4_07915 [Corchorus olitorius]
MILLHVFVPLLLIAVCFNIPPPIVRLRLSHPRHFALVAVTVTLLEIVNRHVYPS